MKTFLSILILLWVTYSSLYTFAGLIGYPRFIVYYEKPKTLASQLKENAREGELLDCFKSSWGD